jgi:SpoVK/Ycf46/Vps4 family AAA+-type ATPase
VAATNRRDALDPALVRAGRLGDCVIEVPRPNLKAARAIFAKHLPASVPYDARGVEPGTVRAEILEAAVSRVYAPNADNQLATLVFRDGRQRAVTARDLVSGAMIANVARTAIERACARDLETGRPGVTLADVLAAIGAEFDAAASVLTPANCRKHLTDLPPDADVVRVDPVRRTVTRSHRYLSVA